MFRTILIALAGLSMTACTPQSAPLKSAGPAETLEVYLTGYSWYDNTPPGSAAIARPQIHRKAGGTGTFSDPITLAVGHSMARGHVLDYPAGTRFYFPRVRKYAIVEDVCGDGPRPEEGPCHIGKSGRPWVDIYVDGRRAGQPAANACMYRITGFQQAVINPGPGLPVVAGALTESGCPTFGT